MEPGVRAEDQRRCSCSRLTDHQILRKSASQGQVYVDNERKGLDLLVVCDDYQVLKAASEWINKASGRVNCVPDAASAKTYITRRKMDGIVLDMRMAGSLELITAIRSGNSNRLSIIFACVAGAQEVTTILQMGANFILHAPWTEEKFVQAFKAAAP